MASSATAVVALPAVLPGVLSAVPSTYTLDARVTPLSAALSALILHYTEASTSAAFGMLLLQLIQRCDRETMPTFNELLMKLTDAGLASAAEYLNDIMNDLNVPDDVLELFADFERAIHPSSGEYNSPIYRASPFGVFLREVVLAFNLMSFCSVARLLDTIIAFRAGAGGSTLLSRRMLVEHIYARVGEIQQSIGNASFLETESMIVDLIRRHNGCVPPQAHYLRYLNCLQHSEFEGAVSNLHRYFDSSGVLGNNAQNQYAILSLASLHLQFGNERATKQALHEAIRIAQQNNDTNCLYRALSVMSSMELGKGQSANALKLLRRTVFQSIVQGSHSSVRRPIANLDAQNYMNSVVCLLQGAGNLPMDTGAVWDQLNNSLLCLDGISDTVGRERTDLYAAHHLLRSAVWFALSNRQLSRLGAQIALLYSPESSQALHALDDLVETSSCGTTSEQAQLLRHRQELVDMGAPHCADVTHGDLRRELKNALNANRIEVARKVLKAMSARNQRTNTGAFTVHFEMELCRIQVELHAQAYQRAYTLATRLLGVCVERRELAMQADVLLLQSRICAEADMAITLVPSVLQTACIAAQLHSVKLRLHSTLHVAAIQLQLNSPQVALSMLLAIVPDVLEHLSPADKAQTYILIAKCLLHLRGDGALKKAIEYLTMARPFCVNILPMLQEVWYYLALSWHQARKKDRRDRCAQEFCNIYFASVTCG